ncbi:MAG: RNA polymerase sigma factor [Planctomycetes bacterium]|nr:RNA polymerase sigma factor [Planctomycetota bacterium]
MPHVHNAPDDPVGDTSGNRLPPPTAKLLARWRSGDEQAFGELAERLSPLLESRIRRQPGWRSLQGHFQINDVLQDVWARALPAVRGKFDCVGRGALLGFLCTVADRTIVDLERARRSQKRGGGDVSRMPTGYEPAAAMPGAPAPESPTSRSRFSELACIAREVLTEREHEAWELVEVHGFTAEEAAVPMNCSSSSVRGLLLRSRAKIIRRLGDCGPGS